EQPPVTLADEPHLRDAAIDLCRRVLLAFGKRRQRLAELDDVAVAVLPIVEEGQIFGDLSESGGVRHAEYVGHARRGRQPVQPPLPLPDGLPFGPPLPLALPELPLPLPEPSFPFPPPLLLAEFSPPDLPLADWSEALPLADWSETL